MQHSVLIGCKISHLCGTANFLETIACLEFLLIKYENGMGW